MKPLLAVALLLVLLLPILSCKKNNTIVDPGPNNNWVTKPQIDIPWPGLANSPWPMFLHDPQHTGRSPYRGPQEGKVEWAYETGNWVYCSPAIGTDGTVYFSSNDGSFYALNASGGLKWQFSVGQYLAIESSTVGFDGTIYAGSGNGVFYAIDQSGNLKWTYTAGGRRSWGAPVPSYNGEDIYFIAYDSSNTASLFDVRRDGSLKWKYIPLSKDLEDLTPAISTHGAIYCPGINGTGHSSLYAVDTSGKELWKFPVVGYTVSPPCVDNDDNVYFAGGGNLYSLTADGALRWQVNAITYDIEISPAIGRDGTVYIASPQFLFAFDYAGTLKWKFLLGAEGSKNTPAIDLDGTIYLGQLRPAFPDSSVFLAINPDGTLKFQMSLRGMSGELCDIDSHPSIGSDGRIYVGSDEPNSHRLFKIK